MATNQQTIDRALYELGYHEYGASADATDAADALIAFNDMMAQWRHQDRDFNWFSQDTLGDTTPLPDWAQGAVQTCLAMRLSTVFNTAPSGQLVQDEVKAKRFLTNTLINLHLENTDMSHLPQGTGVTGRYDINTDS
jgi:hypothetical protein